MKRLSAVLTRRNGHWLVWVPAEVATRDLVAVVARLAQPIKAKA